MLLRRYHNRPKAVSKAAPEPTPAKVEKPVKKAETDDTREEIEKMQFFKIKAYAKRLGLSVDGRNTADLRQMVIEHLGL